MHKFIRWYNQNLRTFWLGFAIIALIFIIIQVLNGLVKEENEQKKNNISIENSSTNKSTTISQTNTSVITGEVISSKNTEINEKTIKQFIEYCNNGKVEDAYSMISDECKELIYPSLDIFKSNYYEKIFYINRMYKLENWYSDSNSYTYYITYTEDVLATGNVNSKDNKSDYITIVKKDTGYKINISSYIGREIIGRTKATNEIGTTCNWLDLYMDYTIANISVKNNSNNIICLDTKENAETTYLYDEKNVKHTGLLNETPMEELIVKKGMTNTVNVKFNKIYNPERELNGIIFSDVVLNYEQYTSKISKKDKIYINVEL